MNLEGKTALVTGGAVRVGNSLTLALAGAGCHVIVHCGQSIAAAEETVKTARGCGVRAEVLPADLAGDAVASLMDQAAELAGGPIEILVNNAAIYPEGGLLENDEEGWSRTLRINLQSPVLLTRAFADRLPPETHGAVLNITDARINRPDTDHFAYRISKTGMAELTRLAALELAPRIRVNALALGAILPPPGAGEDHLQRLAGRIPLRRTGNLSHVTDAALMLLQNDFITGAVLPVDGGEFL